MPFLSLPILAYSAYYDAAALFLFLLVIACAFLRHLNKSKSSKLFLNIMVVCFLASFLDIWLNELSRGYKELNIANIDPNFSLSYTLGTAYVFIRYSIPFIFAIYVLLFTKSMKRVTKSPVHIILTLLPFIILEGIVLTNPLTHILFSLSTDSEGALLITYGQFNFVVTIIELYYFIYIGVVLFRNRKVLLRIQLYSLFSFIPINIIAIIIRVFNNTAIIDMLFYALAFLLIVQNVESPELLIDQSTNLSSSKQFDIAIKRIYTFKENQYILLILIANFNDIYSRFSYNQAVKYIKLLSRKLELIDKKKDVYSLDGGLFAIMFDTKEEINEASEIYLRELSNIRFDNLDFEPEMSISLIDALNDFKSEELLMKYTENFMYVKNKGIMEFNKTKDDFDKIIEYNLDSILENAIKLKQLRIHYQPIYDAVDNKFNYAEALVRIDSPEYGLLVPDYFITYAESRGYIKDIDLFVIEEVMKFITTNDLNKLGLKAISTNLSIVDLNSAEFIENIIRLKTKYKIDPRILKFEITETNGIIFDKNIYEALLALEDEGFDFILDDYGTGYSNLERFAKLPIKYVKLDRGLVKLANEEKMSDVLKTTIDMIHELDRKALIEGVENEVDYNKFIDYNCLYIQGHYFSDPLPKDAFIEFISNKNIIVN